MNGLDEYIIPYLISQAASLVILAVATARTRWARWLFAILFFWAFVVNMYTGLTNPGAYLDYADMAIPPYRDFINGWFNDHKHIIIPLIALGQLFISVGMLLKTFWVKLACIGAIAFLLAISPLLVGSAFPFSITVSVAAFLIYKNDAKNYAWKRGLRTAF